MLKNDEKMPPLKVDVALVHYPVINKKKETIGSAVTNLDLHDIARAGKTFGVNRYWVITPYQEQQQLVGEIVDHWRNGYGKRAGTDRAHALSLIEVCAELQTAVQGAITAYGEEPLLVATGASSHGALVSYKGLREKIWSGTPVMLLFGTAWGLAPDVIGKAQAMLPSIRGMGEFNHLSVRSAVSIILDRLLAVEVD